MSESTNPEDPSTQDAEVQSSDASHAHEEHPSHLRLFLIVFGMLMGLTLLSFAIANSSIMDTPAIGWAAMMAVSCAKAFLVIAFFMHLKWETNWKFVLTIPASIMSILICLILIPDIMQRVEDYSHSRWTYAPTPNSASYEIESESEE